MPDVYAYIRFSSARQSEGSSEARQREMTQDFAKRKGWPQPIEYSDLGVSGFHGDHLREGAGLASFVADCERGKIPRGSIFLIESLDRLSRLKILNGFDLLRKLMQLGVRLITVVDGKEFQEETFDLATAISSVVELDAAHAYAAIISRRVRKAWKAKREAIKEGKKENHRGPAWLKWNVEKNRFDVIAERAAVVRRIFRMAKTGMPKSQITKTLNSERVPTFDAHGQIPKGWYHSYVMRLLANESVIGTYTPTTCENKDGRRERTPQSPQKDYYPKIIEPELFLQVSKLVIRRGRISPLERNIFRGLLQTAKGDPMRFVSKGFSKKRQCSYFYLENSLCQIGRAPRESWAYDDFLDTFVKFVNGYDLAAIIQDDPENDALDKFQVLRAEIESLEKQMANLKKLARLSDNPPKDLLAEMETVRREIDEKTFSAETLRQQAAATVATIENAEEHADRIRQLATRLQTVDGRRRMRAELARVILNIVVKCPTRRDKTRGFVVTFRNGVEKSISVIDDQVLVFDA